MDIFPRGVRARVLAAYFLAMPLGAALGLSLGSALARAADWHTAFLIAGAPGLLLALLALLLPDPVRGTSEGVDEPRLRLHERVGPSQEDYIDLMVNSSYTYSVFGLAFTMFAIGGLVFWLPTFLMVVQGDARRAGELVAEPDGPRGHHAGDRRRGLAGRPVFQGQSEGPVPRAGPGDPRLHPVPPAGDFRPQRGCGLPGRVRGDRSHVHQCRPVLRHHRQRGDAQHARAWPAPWRLAAVHLLGDIWSPTLMGWVADTFGQADSMATPFGHALAAIGAVPKAQPGRDPENLTAALLTAVPALVIAGVVLLAGASHLPREMALMLAKLRAVAEPRGDGKSQARAPCPRSRAAPAGPKTK